MVTVSYVPMSPSKNLNLMGKFTYRASPLLKVSVQLLHSGGKSKSYSHAFKYNPDGTSTSKSSNNNYSIKLNHALSARNFYEANLSLSNTSYMGYQFKPIDLNSAQMRMRQTGSGQMGIFSTISLRILQNIGS